MPIVIPEPNSEDSYFDALINQCSVVIGEGTSRKVHEIPEHDDKVLKVSNIASNYANWCEIVAYQHNKGDGKLAEVLSWSWSGKYVVMTRLGPLQAGEASEYKWPEYLTDRKPSNLGRNKDGTIQAFDYGLLKFPESYESPFG